MFNLIIYIYNIRNDIFPFPPLLEGCIFHKFTFSQFHISTIFHLQSTTYPSYSGRRHAKCHIHIFSVTPSTGPSRPHRPQNEMNEKPSNSPQTDTFCSHFTRFTPQSPLFHDPVCPPSSPPFFRPPKITYAFSHGHPCKMSAHPLHFRITSCHFPSSPLTEFKFFFDYPKKYPYAMKGFKPRFMLDLSPDSRPKAASLKIVKRKIYA